MVKETRTVDLDVAFRTIKVKETLDKVVSVDEEGFAKFAAGWDDAEVARITGTTVASVQHVRKGAFGPLKRRGTVRYHQSPAKSTTANERLAALETAVADITKRLDDLVAALGGIR